MMTRLYTSHEVAGLVRVSPSAVLRWIDQGLLKAYRTPGGHRRIRSPELLEFLRVHEMPVPTELEFPKVRVLIIDDESQYLQSLGTILAAADKRIEVELCESPVDGLLKIGLRRPDVLVIDTYMPGMDGREVCRRLKEAPETRDVAVIAMSGRPSEVLEQQFRDAGASAFLPKPVSATAIFHHLMQLGLVQLPERIT